MWSYKIKKGGKVKADLYPNLVAFYLILKDFYAFFDINWLKCAFSLKKQALSHLNQYFYKR